LPSPRKRTRWLVLCVYSPIGSMFLHTVGHICCDLRKQKCD
jgi:hypothetical protein